MTYLTKKKESLEREKPYQNERRKKCG